MVQVDPGLGGSRETVKVVVAYNLSRRRLVSGIAHAGVGWHPRRVSRILVTLIHTVPLPQIAILQKGKKNRLAEGEGDPRRDRKVSEGGARRWGESLDTSPHS